MMDDSVNGVLITLSEVGNVNSRSKPERVKLCQNNITGSHLYWLQLILHIQARKFGTKPILI